MTLLPRTAIAWPAPAVQVRARQGAPVRSADRGPPFSDRGTWPGPQRPAPARELACRRHADGRPHPSWRAWPGGGALAEHTSRRQAYHARTGLITSHWPAFPARRQRIHAVLRGSPARAGDDPAVDQASWRGWQGLAAV